MAHRKSSTADHATTVPEDATMNRSQRRAAARRKKTSPSSHGPNPQAVGADSKKFATKSKANSRKYTIRKV